MRQADTRERLLDAAEEHFADRGFYGTSIAQIAASLDITKQALLHHFGSKEKLYGAVLERLSLSLQHRLTAIQDDHGDPLDCLTAVITDFAGKDTQQAIRNQILMRELLDNSRRAQQVDAWYLKTFLETLIGLTRQIDGWQTADDMHILSTLYQLLGAMTFYTISGPTLSGMFGARRIADLDLWFSGTADQLVRTILLAPAKPIVP